MNPQRLSGVGLLTLCMATYAMAAPEKGGLGPVLINEIRIEQPGPDLDEYVELRGTPGTNLSGWFYVVIGNDDFALPPSQNGFIEEVIALKGIIPASGLFVVAEESFTLGRADQTSAFVFEGGNNKTHLLVQGFTGAAGDDLDTNDDGILDSTPWAALDDSIALIQFPSPDGVTGDFVYSATTIGPDAGVVPSQVWRCSDSFAWNLGQFTVGVTDTPGADNPTCRGEKAPILLSEIRIDQTATDDDEYFELSGTPGASLDGVTYIVIGDGTAAQASGVIEMALALDGHVIASDGLFLVAEDENTFGAIADFVTPGGTNGNALNFENSDNVTHLLVRGYVAPGNLDLDTNDDGVLDVIPWTEVLDGVAFVESQSPPTGAGNEWWYALPIGPDGPFGPGHLYRCQPNGAWQIGNFDPAALSAADTPGTANVACESCGVIGSGNCFKPHAGGGCEDESCCDLVCGADPTCCGSEWDQACADLAKNLCHTPGSPPAVVINEIRIDEPGADLQEYFELRGAPGTPLDGVAYVVLGFGPNDPAGVVESITKLDGKTIAPNGFFVVAKSTFSLASANFVVPSNGFNFNSSSSKTHLLVWNAETIRGEDLDTNDDCTLDGSLAVSVIDEVVFSAPDETGCVYGEPLVGPDCNGFPPAHIYRCKPTDAWTIGAFGNFANDTPTAANVDCGAVEVFTCGDVCAGDCKTVHANAHCSNATCCEEVCAIDPDCCGSNWDAACVAIANGLTACGGGDSEVLINEIRIDQPSTDVDEYFELVGAPGTSLDGYAYLVIGDSAEDLSGVVEAIIPLDGFALNAGGFFLVTEETFSLPGTPDLVLRGANPINFENADNVTHLLVSGFTGKIDDDLDTNDDGVLDVVPWAKLHDSIALVSTSQPAPSGAAEWWYGARIGPDGGGTPGHVFRCDSLKYWQIGGFDPSVGGLDSPGFVNELCPNQPTCSPTPDQDGNGCVNGGDITVVLGSWDPTGALGNGFGPGDANCDGFVDGADITSILGGWQPICP